jgi:hypothetical protein
MGTSGRKSFFALCFLASIQFHVAAFRLIRGGQTPTTVHQSSNTELLSVPSKGMIDYIGRTVPIDVGVPRWSTDELIFQPPKPKQMSITRFNLFRQYPWKKIRGKVILKAKISGSLPLDGAPSGGPFGFGGKSDLEPVESLAELQNMFNYASFDPRVQAIVLEIGK